MKTVRDAPLTTRNARSKLAAGAHWRGLDKDVHLGYRKGKHGGTWLVRWRVYPGYRQVPIGTADDLLVEGTLDYAAACRVARQTVETARRTARAAADGPVLKVRTAVEEYIAERDVRESKRKGRTVRSDAGQRLSRYVVGQEKRGKQPAIPAAQLADVALHALSEDDLLNWRNGLPDGLKAGTKQRLVNDVKAALNAAYAKHRKRLDPVLPSIIRHGLRAANGYEEESEPLARDNQILNDAQVSLLIRTAKEVDADEQWDGDLYRLVVVLAATGARFSQIARMQVADCQPREKRLLVPRSRKGRGKSGSVPVPVGQDVLEALLPAVTGRAREAPLLERRQRIRVPGGILWEDAGRGPWQTPSELARPWDDIRTRAELSHVIPYALRHSSIVRALKHNLPVRLVAAMHDTSVAMLERHYSRWIAHGLEELAARAVVPLILEDNNVLRMRTA